VLHPHPQRLGTQAANLADAIAASGHSPTSLLRLAEVEQKIAEVDRQRRAHQEFDATASLAEIREFVTKELLDIGSILREEVTKTKLALRRHIRDLVLTSKEAGLASTTKSQVRGSWCQRTTVHQLWWPGTESVL